VETTVLEKSLAALRERNIRIIGADPHTDRKSIYEMNFAMDCCVILGSEGVGLAPQVLMSCHERVAIPMRNEVDSLNVGSAAAVFFYEAARQRESKLQR
jgi:23S rRNA (guanosine2251-2'-O)-methyltransferase